MPSSPAFFSVHREGWKEKRPKKKKKKKKISTNFSDQGTKGRAQKQTKAESTIFLDAFWSDATRSRGKAREGGEVTIHLSSSFVCWRVKAYYFSLPLLVISFPTNPLPPNSISLSLQPPQDVQNGHFPHQMVLSTVQFWHFEEIRKYCISLTDTVQ